MAKLGPQEAAEIREQQLALLALKMDEPRRSSNPTAAERERRLEMLRIENQIDDLRRAAEGGMHSLVFLKWSNSNRRALRALGAKLSEDPEGHSNRRGQPESAALFTGKR